MGSYFFDFQGGPWNGMTIVLLRRYEQIMDPQWGTSKYVWNLKEEAYVWQE